MLSLCFTALCMGGLFFVLPPRFPLAAHFVVLLVVLCSWSTKVFPEASHRTVRKGFCVIGLAFERHVA